MTPQEDDNNEEKSRREPGNGQLAYVQYILNCLSTMDAFARNTLEQDGETVILHAILSTGEQEERARCPSEDPGPRARSTLAKLAGKRTTPKKTSAEVLDEQDDNNFLAKPIR
jgi:hypothetical protein